MIKIFFDTRKNNILGISDRFFRSTILAIFLLNCLSLLVLEKEAEAQSRSVRLKASVNRNPRRKQTPQTKRAPSSSQTYQTFNKPGLTTPTLIPVLPPASPQPTPTPIATPIGVPLNSLVGSQALLPNYQINSGQVVRTFLKVPENIKYGQGEKEFDIFVGGGAYAILSSSGEDNHITNSDTRFDPSKFVTPSGVVSSNEYKLSALETFVQGQKVLFLDWNFKINEPLGVLSITSDLKKAFNHYEIYSASGDELKQGCGYLEQGDWKKVFSNAGLPLTSLAAALNIYDNSNSLRMDQIYSPCLIQGAGYVGVVHTNIPQSAKAEDSDIKSYVKANSFVRLISPFATYDYMVLSASVQDKSGAPLTSNEFDLNLGVFNHPFASATAVAVQGRKPGQQIPAGATVQVRLKTALSDPPALVATGAPLGCLPYQGFMNAGGSLSSPNGSVRLVKQYDGNLVLYSQNIATWAAYGQLGPLVLDEKGLLLYREMTDDILTAHKFFGPLVDYPNSALCVQDDGNLVLYGNGTSKTNPLWHTGTYI